MLEPLTHYLRRKPDGLYFGYCEGRHIWTAKIEFAMKFTKASATDNALGNKDWEAVEAPEEP